jgi:N-acetylneuraminic acid mutarotase
MEIYDVRANEWSILDDKLPIRISNHACFSHEENNIMIIGGGY